MTDILFSVVSKCMQTHLRKAGMLKIYEYLTVNMEEVPWCCIMLLTAVS